MSNLHFHLEKTFTSSGTPVAVLVISGFISAATEDIFLNALEQLQQQPSSAALDFTSVAYINSTSFGELMAFAQSFVGSGRKCCLFALRADTLFLFRQMGLDQIFPVLENRIQALEYLESSGEDIPESAAVSSASESRGLVRHTARFSAELGRGRVIAAMDPADPLLPVLWRLLRHRAFPISKTAQQVREELERGPVELAVVDCQHPEYRDLSVMLSPAGKAGASAVLCLGCGCAVGQMSEPSTREALRRLREGGGSPIERRKRAVAAELLVRGAKLELRSEVKACELGRVICQRMALAAGMNRNAADSFFFAVREAIDNACTHGNRLDPARKVTVCFMVRPGRLEVTVHDEGAGFAYHPWLKAAESGPLVQAKKRVDEGEKGGLGITLMRCCCDNIEFLQSGNAVRLSKNLHNLPYL